MADFFSGGGGTQTQSGNQFGSQNQFGSSRVIPGAIESDLKSLYATNLGRLANSSAWEGQGLGYFAQPFKQFYQPGEQEQGILNQIMGLAGANRFSPEMTQGADTIRGLLDRGFQGTSMPTVQQLLQMAMQGPNSLETGGLETMRARTDPTALTTAAQKYMEDIFAPSARAGLQAGGLGGARGGALTETLGREGSRLALPIAQMIQQAQGEYGGAQMGVGAGLESRRAGLAGLLEQMRQGQVAERSGLANQLFGMGQQDIRPTQLGLLQNAQRAAAVPRMGSIADLQRQQGLLTQFLGGMPFTPSITTETTGGLNTSGGSSGTTGVQNDLTFGSFLGPLTNIAAASILNPKGATQAASNIGDLFRTGTDGFNALSHFLRTGGGFGDGSLVSGNETDLLSFLG